MQSDTYHLKTLLFAGLFILILSVLSGQSQTLPDKNSDVITRGPANGYLVIVGGNLSDPAI